MAFRKSNERTIGTRTTILEIQQADYFMIGDSLGTAFEWFSTHLLISYGIVVLKLREKHKPAKLPTRVHVGCPQ